MPATITAPASFAVDAAAAWRVTRLVTEDTITAPVRDRADAATGPVGRWLSDLLSCPHCVGVWAAAAVVAARAVFPVGWPYAARALALAAAVSIVSEIRAVVEGP